MNENIELYDQLMNSSTKQDLVIMAKAKSIAVKVSMRKGDIARLLVDKMLRPDVITDYIKWMDPRERKFFLSLAGLEKPVDDITDMEEMMFPMNLFESGYLFFDDIDGDPFLTEDVKSLLRKVWTHELKAGCRQYEWIIQCLELASQIYGVVPYTVLARLIRQKVQYGVSVSALPRILREIPEDIRHYSVGTERVYDKTIESLVSKLEFPSEGEDYYIPSVFEIENGVFYTEEVEKLIGLRIEDMKQKFPNGFWCVEDTAWRICAMKSLESSKCSMRDIIIAEEDFELFDKETGDLNKAGETLCETFKKLDKHFRRVCYNGFTKKEWDARHNNKPVQLPLDRITQTVNHPPSQTAKVISLDERRRKKKNRS